jgi:hypothetical protein
MFDYSTAACIICGGKAHVLTGHVHVGEQRVLAGWCGKHQNSKGKERPGYDDCVGCHGEWRHQDGLIQEQL